MAIGRISSGVIELNKRLSSVDQGGTLVENSKVGKIIKKLGQVPIELERAVAGDIVSVSGFAQSGVTHTLNEN
jgi:predicted membrane GTPase involved in stress response